MVEWVVGAPIISVVDILVAGWVEIFVLEGDKLVKVEELVSALLIEAGVVGLFFVELVVVRVSWDEFRGSFPNVLKMYAWL